MPACALPNVSSIRTMKSGAKKAGGKRKRVPPTPAALLVSVLAGPPAAAAAAAPTLTTLGAPALLDALRPALGDVDTAPTAVALLDALTALPGPHVAGVVEGACTPLLAAVGSARSNNPLPGGLPLVARWAAAHPRLTAAPLAMARTRGVLTVPRPPPPPPQPPTTLRPSDLKDAVALAGGVEGAPTPSPIFAPFVGLFARVASQLDAINECCAAVGLPQRFIGAVAPRPALPEPWLGGASDGEEEEEEGVPPSPHGGMGEEEDEAWEDVSDGEDGLAVVEAAQAAGGRAVGGGDQHLPVLEPLRDAASLLRRALPMLRQLLPTGDPAVATWLRATVAAVEWVGGLSTEEGPALGGGVAVPPPPPPAPDHDLGVEAAVARIRAADARKRARKGRQPVSVRAAPPPVAPPAPAVPPPPPRVAPPPPPPPPATGGPDALAHTLWVNKWKRRR